MEARRKPSTRRVVRNYVLIILGTYLLVVPGLSYLAPHIARWILWFRMKERITVGRTPKSLEEVHRARYEFAKQYCAGKHVADIASGEGYGTVMLREVAASVDPYDKLRFADNIVIDLEKERWSKRYDVIVSLETVEHLQNPEFFLRNIAETSDLAVISTPMNEPKGYNPFHKQTWSAPEFKRLLERFFTCEYYSQQGNQFPLDSQPAHQMVAVCRPLKPPG